MQIFTPEQGLHIHQAIRNMPPEAFKAIVDLLHSNYMDICSGLSMQRPGEPGAADANWKRTGGLLAIERAITDLHTIRTTELEKLNATKQEGEQ